MARLDFVLINVVGLLISIFSVYVTYNLFNKYRLRRSLGFLFTAIMITIWNICHILYDLVPADSYLVARGVFILANASGMFIILGTLFSFSMLRHENMDFKLLIYTFVLSSYLAVIVVKPSWMDIVYQAEFKAWNSVVYNDWMWNTYAFFILFFLTIEFFHPLFTYYRETGGQAGGWAMGIVILAALGALISGLLLDFLLTVGLPPVSRYILTNLSFLGIFYIFYTQPFVGIQDDVEVRQILVSNDAGMPILSSSDLGEAALATGALHGINTILDEITGPDSNFISEKDESTRKIELTEERFFIIRQGTIISIFQYANHSGVCVAKFTSLGRTLRDRSLTLQDRMHNFIDYFREIYPDQSDLISSSMITNVTE